jgi:hypothetical protein
MLPAYPKRPPTGAELRPGVESSMSTARHHWQELPSPVCLQDLIISHDSTIIRGIAPRMLAPFDSEI